MKFQEASGSWASYLSKKRRSLTRVVLLGLFASLALMSPIIASAITFSSTVSYNISTTGSGVTTMTSMVSTQGTILPKTVTLTLAAYFNGSSTAITRQSCTVPVTHSGAWCMFHVPWKGVGYYKLVGSVYGSGNLISKTTIDPLAEPAWYR